MIIQMLLYRGKDTLNILFLTGSVLLIMCPWELFNISFQLSFGATAGIILFYRLYKNTFALKNEYLKSSIAISMAAQLFTAPILWFHLNEICTAGIITNILAIPIVTAVMISAIISAALFPISSFIAHGLSLITGHLLDMLIFIAKCISKANIYLYTENPLVIIMMTILLLLTLLKSRVRYLNFIIIVIIIMTPLVLKQFLNRTIEKEHISEIYRGNSIFLNKSLHASREEILKTLNMINITIDSVVLNPQLKENLYIARFIMNHYRIKELIFTQYTDRYALKDLIYMAERDKIKIVVK